MKGSLPPKPKIDLRLFINEDGSIKTPRKPLRSDSESQRESSFTTESRTNSFAQPESSQSSHSNQQPPATSGSSINLGSPDRSLHGSVIGSAIPRSTSESSIYSEPPERRPSSASERNYALKPLHASVPSKTHLADHNSPPTIPVNFLSNKTRKLLAANDRFVCINTSTKTALYSWRSSALVWNTKENVTTAVFGPDGNTIWLGTKSGSIIIKESVNGTTIHSISRAHLKPITFLAAIEAGIVSLSGDDGKLVVWSSTPGNKALRMQRVAIRTELAVTGGNRSCFLWTSKDHQVNVYNPSGSVFGSHSVELIRRGANLGAITSIAAFHDTAFFGQNDGFIAVFRGTQFLGSINGGIYSITALTAPSATELWAGTRSGDISIFQLHSTSAEDSIRLSATLLRQWHAHSSRIDQIILADAKAAVVSSDRTGAIRAWNATPSDIIPAAPSISEGFMVQVLTWNVGASTPSAILPSDIVNEWTPKADIISIGLQEVVDSESTSQHAIRMVTNGDAGNTEEHEKWQQFLESTLIPYGFTSVKVQPLLGIMILLFVKREKAVFMSDISAQVVRTGIGGTYGNKGGVIISYDMFGMTWSFTNCHLAAGHSAIMQRNRDANQIVEAAGLRSSISFFFGDTNYRISAAREQAEQLIKTGNWKELRRMDQSISQKTKNPSFSLCRFDEGLLNFQPTYKYNVGTSVYDTSEKRRVPAWCDRILFRGKSIQVLQYEPNNSVVASDHKPVVGTYIVPQSIPG